MAKGNKKDKPLYKAIRKPIAPPRIAFKSRKRKLLDKAARGEY